MVRGSGSENIDLGLGPHLVGKQIEIHGRSLEICAQLGEGGFSFVYLVRNRGDRDSDDVVLLYDNASWHFKFARMLCI